MIITKATGNVSGSIEYRYDYNRNSRFLNNITSEEDDSMFESDTFNSLEELLDKLKPESMAWIKENYDADKVWVSSISFHSISEDKKD